MNVGDELQIVIFRVGPQQFALNIYQVERILRYEKPAALPKAPDFLEGVLSYEGDVVPVVDLRKRLDVAAPIDPETRVMVLEIDAQRIAIVVDQVVEVTRVDSAAIAPPPPIVRGLAAEYISGILARPVGTVVFLNAGKLFSSTERVALTAVGSEARA